MVYGIQATKLDKIAITRNLYAVNWLRIEKPALHLDGIPAVRATSKDAMKLRKTGFECPPPFVIRLVDSVNILS